LFGLIAMLSGGGIGTPNTEAVRQFKSGISSSEAAGAAAGQQQGSVE
jgi:hypothetical protein